MNVQEKRLLRAYRTLGEGRRETLLDFAEFLAGRDTASGEAQYVPSEPLDIPRPEQESVVNAIKRLMATFPMLDRNKLLHETSSFMTQHVIHRKPAVEVIDGLEAAFRRHFEAYQIKANQKETVS